MEKKRNLWVIPTSKPSRLFKDDFGKYFISINIDQEQGHFKPQNIYITSDEEIKDGDWMIRGNEQPTLVTPNFFWDFGVRYYKIILTTDQDLIKDGVQAIDDTFLEWFVKNPSCEFVPIIPPLFGHPYIIWIKGLNFIEKPKQIKCYCGHTITCDCEPEQETLEEAAENIYPVNIESIMDGYHDSNSYQREAFINGAKWQAERMYSEEEVIKIVKKSRETGLTAEFLLLTEQFKKK